jgi:hypothetical protein
MAGAPGKVMPDTRASSAVQDATETSQFDVPSDAGAAEAGVGSDLGTAIPDATVSRDLPLADDGVDAAKCPLSCDDNNACTEDSCDPQTGGCVNLPMPEGSACTNPCLVGGTGQCKLGVCQGTAVPDGRSCEDGNPCTLSDACKGGLCYSGPNMPCPAVDLCHEAGHCDRSTGTCTQPKVDDGKECDDGLSCTIADQCTDGVCGGAALACSGEAACDVNTGICKTGATNSFPSGVAATAWQKIRQRVSGALSCDGSGNVFVAGALVGATDIGTGLLVPVGVRPDASVATSGDALVAKVNLSTGRADWTLLFGDEQMQQGQRVVANNTGQLAVTGTFTGSITLGTSTATNPTATYAEVFVAGVDAATGAGLWALRPEMRAPELAVDSDPKSGDFIVCGTVTKVAALGLVPDAVAADADGDIVVARLDARTGARRWGKQIPAPARQSCDAIAVDGAGHVYLGGTTSSVGGSTSRTIDASASIDAGGGPFADFGGGVGFDLPVLSGVDSVTVGWLVKLDVETGKALDAIRFGAPGNNGAQSIRQLACDNAGDVIVAGGFRNQAAIGTTSLAGGNTESAWVVKLSSGFAPVWARSWGAVNDVEASSLALESEGTILVVGGYTWELTLDNIALAKGRQNDKSSFIARLAADGRILSARGYGSPGGAESVWGLGVVGGGPQKGLIVLSGESTGSLQLGPPAPGVDNSGGPSIFLGQVAR